MGIANYAIQGPKQVSPYKSLRICDTVQEALEDALPGFLAFWDPKYANQTRFELDEDW
ncbi:MAG: hypothetical protein AOA66_1219 [Candidatus Bathyarchaeota archaeon BA2]|nr:MAG: hypothetical protein AOA66_1219 [Candidatus Bathyarchaeota archaeon BA2]